MKTVDCYMGSNRILSEERHGGERTALFETMSMEDYDAIYGVDDDDCMYELSLHGEVYREMNQHRDELTILYICPHGGDQDRHHPDYSKPLEVELLCKACHWSRHKTKAMEIISKLFIKKKKLDNAIKT
jgi:hypothetical protein